MEGDVVARCHHVAIVFGVHDTRNTPAGKSLDTPCELNVFSFILIIIDTSHTWNYGETIKV